MAITNRWYGWRKDRLDKRDRMLKVGRPIPLPPSVDLRLEMPVVYDQGPLGSCTAQAIAAALDHLEVKQGISRMDSPSRLFIYYEERVIEETISEDSGAEIRDGIKVVSKLGVPDEILWPYNIPKFTMRPPQEAYDQAVSRLAIQYQKIESSEVTSPETFMNAVRTVLAQGHTIIFGFSVWSSFESSDIAKSGIMPMPDIETEDMMGGHAVLMVGYDDATKRVLVRNSWSADWGQAGYFEMPYEFLVDPKQAADLWTIGITS